MKKLTTQQINEAKAAAQEIYDNLTNLIGESVNDCSHSFDMDEMVLLEAAIVKELKKLL